LHPEAQHISVNSKEGTKRKTGMWKGGRGREDEKTGGRVRRIQITSAQLEATLHSYVI
jgi:hypothetical protein